MHRWLFAVSVCFLLAAPARAGGGGAAGSEFQVNAYTTGYQIVPSVAADRGDFVVAWES